MEQGFNERAEVWPGEDGEHTHAKRARTLSLQTYHLASSSRKKKKKKKDIFGAQENT